jgi:hypothetical protein
VLNVGGRRIEGGLYSCSSAIRNRLKMDFTVKSSAISISHLFLMCRPQPTFVGLDQHLSEIRLRMRAHGDTGRGSCEAG